MRRGDASVNIRVKYVVKSKTAPLGVVLLHMHSVSLSPPLVYANNTQAGKVIVMEIPKKTYLDLLEKAEKYDALLPTHQKMYVELHRRQAIIDTLQETVENCQKPRKK